MKKINYEDNYETGADDDFIDLFKTLNTDDFWFRVTHSVEVTRHTMEAMEAAGKLGYPNECCGMVVGDDDIHHDEVFVVKNVNSYKRAAYKMDPAQQVGILNMAEKRGLKLRILYHSHPEMGAFFSGTDRADATSVKHDEPDWSPDTVYIVMSIKLHDNCGAGEPRLDDARAYQWNPAINDFSEITLKVVDDGGKETVSR